MADTLEQFREMLYGRCLPRRGQALAAAIMSVAPEDQEQALTEALEWFRAEWMSEGGWDALRHLPPTVLGSHDASFTRFMQILFPFGPRRGGIERPPYQLASFWKWQKGQAGYLSNRLRPEMPIARAKWLQLCGSDPCWGEAVETLGEMYQTYARMEAESAPRPGWDRNAHWDRAAAARAGDLTCGHATGIAPCVGCDHYDADADERHWGWKVRTRTDRTVAGARSHGEPERPLCACCKANHDRRPVGKIACCCCAEAMFWMASDFFAQRWGGWYWLQSELRWQAREQVLRQDPRVSEWELRAGLLTPSAPEGETSNETASRELWRSDRWHQLRRGVDVVGTLLIPVEVRSTDLKRDIDERAQFVIDALWTRLKIRTPRSTASTPTRSVNWDRYLDWLWQNRIDGLPVTEIETRHGSVDADGLTSASAILQGISKALEVLGPH